MMRHPVYILYTNTFYTHRMIRVHNLLYGFCTRRTYGELVSVLRIFFEILNCQLLDNNLTWFSKLETHNITPGLWAKFKLGTIMVLKVRH